MTTATRHTSTTHVMHLPTDVPRRIAAVVLGLIGVALLATTFVNNLFNVGPSFEDLMKSFRPHLTSAAITTAHSDVNGLSAAGTEMQSKMLPTLAAELKMTPAQLSAYLSGNFAQVSAGVTQLPGIVTRFDGVVTTLDKQRPLFASADAIPTKSLPATTVPWGLAFAGIAALGAGALMWWRPRVGGAVAAGVGLLLVAVPLMLSLPGKASDADKLNANLKPVYTASFIAQANSALSTVSGMGTQMQSSLLPALATQLKMPPAQLQQFLGQQFPATSAALATMSTTVPRFQSLVTAFDKNLGNYNTLKPVKFVPIINTLLVCGILTLLAGATVVLWPRHRQVSLHA